MNRWRHRIVKYDNTQSEEVKSQRQLEGHIHPNFRYMNWFRPSGMDS